MSLMRDNAETMIERCGDAFWGRRGEPLESWRLYQAVHLDRESSAPIRRARQVGFYRSALLAHALDRIQFNEKPTRRHCGKKDRLPARHPVTATTTLSKYTLLRIHDRERRVHQINKEA